MEGPGEMEGLLPDNGSVDEGNATARGKELNRDGGADECDIVGTIIFSTDLDIFLEIQILKFFRIRRW